jgi:hypothetical protein
MALLKLLLFGVVLGCLGWVAKTLIANDRVAGTTTMVSGEEREMVKEC